MRRIRPVTGIQSDLLIAVHPDTRELQIGMLDDRQERKMSDETCTELYDSMRHFGLL